MIKSIDSLFYIGKDHTICDDYSVVYRNNNYTLAGVSDGCSSSKNSSLGSRFFLLEIIKTFEFVGVEFCSTEDYKFMLKQCIKNLKIKYGHILGNCFLDTTMLFSITSRDQTIVLMVGDGTIISKNKKGEEVVTTIDFENNMPFYPSYYDDEDRLIRYSSLVEYYTTNQNDIEYKTKIYDGFFKTFIFNHRDIDSLILCTDGISSFVKDGLPVSTIEMSKKLLDIKSIKGEFLQRRVKTIKKEFEHLDDLSAVGLIFE